MDMKLLVIQKINILLQSWFKYSFIVAFILVDPLAAIQQWKRDSKF